MRTFLRVFYRKHLSKGKLTILSLAGLVLGMFTFMFITYYVYVESNYDQHLPNNEQIYHLTTQVEKNGVLNLYSTTTIPLAETLFKEIPQIKSWATFCSIFETNSFEIKQKEFLNGNIIYANTDFFKVFQLKAIYGQLENALEASGTVVITRAAAIKYFGAENALGQRFTIHHDKQKPIDVTVRAVVNDIPENSNVKFEMVCCLEDYLNCFGNWIVGWHIKASQSYILLEEKADLLTVRQSIDKVVDKYISSKSGNTAEQVKIIPEELSEKHFKKAYTLVHPTEKFVNKSSLKILFLVGIIALIISWLNFISFSIHKNALHFKEIGVRKVVGSSKSQLFISLIKESILLNSIPVLVSVVLFLLLSPVLAGFFDMDIQFVKINSFSFWLSICLLLLLGSLITALYPILKLVGIQPISILKNKAQSGSAIKFKGRVFLSIQFALSIFLIVGITTIFKQSQFLQNQDLGFQRDKVIVLPAPITENAEDYMLKTQLFKEKALQNANIMAISGASSIPGKRLSTVHFGLRNREETINKYHGVECDPDYFAVLGVNLIAGRNFYNRGQENDPGIIINEAMLHKLGFANAEDALGQYTNWGDRQIIGVAENYNHLSLHSNVQPMIFQNTLNRLVNFMVQVSSNDMGSKIDFLEKNWEAVYANSPFQYSFLSDEYNLQYHEDKRLSRLTLVFSIISILITILGLIGNCLNEMLQRTKEVGIRKVNGAKIVEILKMFNLNILKWVGIAFMVVCPISWFALSRWLNSFAYKTHLSWWIFALAGSIAILIAVLTISLQSWQAARRNPIEALKYE